ncbi:MAG: tRNA (N6-isopentenyl adenosine(37)-C2)-methylthiotransferase MiaB [Saprospiraceae bacterium]|jgi:tRNA-2-methylthio-N6-dimethylallyladenosine synthase|nr:tRNA (N6-isopentenyl adenosine(37)-C2)-methylthiotransferase MiaB [Saprospiraceae bacterium]MBP9210069.1 tRNA (N6-isopentenyl adenosine(37)-C2)-methylthiotransferase MiaB [Saprospiraceae bacterium]MBV6472916.1 tRNA-2-methylthio-N(6)-dimethylallyladenosine synthase [Saprospiraceae bacterium]
MHNEISTALKTQMPEERQGQPIAFETGISAAGARTFYLESYGCQMNFSDSEIVASILAGEGYRSASQPEEADLLLLNTCSIREKAEETIRRRLREFRALKKSRPTLQIGILGCMAERLKNQWLEQEKLVDLVVGPDAYRDLPRLLQHLGDGQRAVNVLLSREETYSDIAPLRLDGNGISAFVSIMRGCDNMCSFCVVPFTRGRERSRDVRTILDEVRGLADDGYREVTLLGQNVDSYRWAPDHNEDVSDFADLLDQVACAVPSMRIRFSTSHPKDLTNKVLHTMARHDNICNYIHLPCQSGSSRILELMNRTYDRNWYMAKVDEIRTILPDCAISSDIIAGFCTETEEDHADTLSLMRSADFCMSYMFCYSERPGTLAARKWADDVPEQVKKRRLSEIIALQNEISLAHNRRDVGQVTEVLVEGRSRRSDERLRGRNLQNKMVVFDDVSACKPGDCVRVLIQDATSATLMGSILP